MANESVKAGAVSEAEHLAPQFPVEIVAQVPWVEGLRDRRCKASQEEVIAALEGDYRPEYLFVLRDLQEQLEEVRTRMARIDEEMARQVGLIGRTAQASRPGPEEPGAGARGTKAKAKKLGRNAVVLDYQTESERFYGVDLTSIVGINSGVIVPPMSDREPGEAARILQKRRRLLRVVGRVSEQPHQRRAGAGPPHAQEQQSDSRRPAPCRLRVAKRQMPDGPVLSPDEGAARQGGRHHGRGPQAGADHLLDDPERPGLR